MARWAEVCQGRVLHLFEAAEGFIPQFAPPLQAVQVLSGNPQEGDSWNGVAFGPPPAPNPTDIQAHLVSVVQVHLDALARSRNYDGILSLCSYATSTHPVFGAEGRAGLAWRDACWAHCYQVMADVQASLRPIPTADQLVDELPAMTWGV